MLPVQACSPLNECGKWHPGGGDPLTVRIIDSVVSALWVDDVSMKEGERRQFTIRLWHWRGWITLARAAASIGNHSLGL